MRSDWRERLKKVCSLFVFLSLSLCPSFGVSFSETVLTLSLLVVMYVYIGVYRLRDLLASLFPSYLFLLMDCKWEELKEKKRYCKSSNFRLSSHHRRFVLSSRQFLKRSLAFSLSVCLSLSRDLSHARLNSLPPIEKREEMGYHTLKESHYMSDRTRWI